MYQYTGKPFKGAKIENLSSEAIETLLAWGYIIKTIEGDNLNDKSTESQQLVSNDEQPNSKSKPSSRNK